MIQSRSGAVINNTFFLYIRSFLTMIIGIYTSRVLLAALGVDDYGIYNLVAGIVAMFSSLKGVFASSIQRFLNYAKGQNNADEEGKIFNLSLIIHFGLAIIFGILVECVGIWFIYEKLNIPTDSIDNALFVFHFAVLTTVMTIACVPFDAVVIANEKFKYFAWLTLTDAILKLLIVYLLAVLPYHQLRSYAVLLFLIGAFNVSVNVIFCRRFKECKLYLAWDTNLFKKLASFSAWNFFGNTAFSLVNEGLNMILNIFGGVAINAGRGIAYQVKSAVQTLCNNIFVAVQPVIVQQAAQKEKEVIFSNICQLSRLNFFISAITVLPIFIFSEYILNIWLGEIPPLSEVFVKLLMLYITIRSLHSPIDLLFKAYGDIKRYQIVDSATLVLSIPISYFVLKIGVPLYFVFITMCVVEVINLSSIVLCAHKQLGFSSFFYFKQVGVPCLLGVTIYFTTACLINTIIVVNGFLEFILYTIAIVVTAIVIAVVLLNKEDRILVVTFVRSRIRR